MATDNKKVGASYIINFYQLVSSLTDAYGQYADVYNRLKSQYGEDTDEFSFEGEDLQVLKNACMAIRQIVSKSYIMLVSLKDNINGFPEIKQVIKLYQSIVKSSKKYIVDVDELESYTIELNKLLLKNILKDLIDTSNELFSQIYGNEE